MSPSPRDLTQLLQAWSEGDQSAMDELMPLVYQDLHRLAHRHMAREPGQCTLQTTVLIHETYLRLVDSKRSKWKDRAHFFAVCARLMRHVLVDAARSRAALKRGANLNIVELDESMGAPTESPVDIIALDEALNSLNTFDQRKGQVFELRIFGGLSVEETAQALKISSDTVTRDMHLATAWLRRELSRKGKRGP